MAMTKMRAIPRMNRLVRLTQPDAQTPEERAEAASEWYHRDPDRVNKRIKRWRDMNPRKRAAHLAVKRAMYSGELVRPANCEENGCSKKPEGHHDDYDYELAVMWLCRRHHRLRHVKLKAEGRDPDTLDVEEASA